MNPSTIPGARAHYPAPSQCHATVSMIARAAAWLKPGLKWTGSWPWWGRERAFAGQGHFPASRKELEAVFLRDIWKGKNELLAEGDAATGVGCTRMVRGVIREELVAKENPSRRSTRWTYKVLQDDCGWGFKFPVYAHQGTVSLEERSATRTSALGPRTIATPSATVVPAYGTRPSSAQRSSTFTAKPSPPCATIPRATSASTNAA